MACPNHPYPLGHLAFRLLDHSFERLILDILTQADVALVNAPILLPFEVFVFKYLMERFAEHVRIDSKTNTSKVPPSCYMWYPLLVKIFCKCSCCRRAVKTQNMFVLILRPTRAKYPHRVICGTHILQMLVLQESCEDACEAFLDIS